MDWISTYQARVLTGLSQPALCRLVAQGRVERRRVGVRTEYLRSSLLRIREQSHARRPPPKDNWITKPAAGLMLGVSLATIYRMCRLGVLSERSGYVSLWSVKRAWSERTDRGYMGVRRDDGKLRGLARPRPPRRDETLSEECPNFFTELASLERFRRLKGA